MEMTEIGGRVFTPLECNRVTDKIITCIQEEELTVQQAEYFLDEVKEKIKCVRV